MKLKIPPFWLFLLVLQCLMDLCAAQPEEEVIIMVHHKDISKRKKIAGQRRSTQFTDVPVDATTFAARIAIWDAEEQREALKCTRETSAQMKEIKVLHLETDATLDYIDEKHYTSIEKLYLHTFFENYCFANAGAFARLVKLNTLILSNVNLVLINLDIPTHVQKFRYVIYYPFEISKNDIIQIRKANPKVDIEVEVILNDDFIKIDKFVGLEITFIWYKFKYHLRQNNEIEVEIFETAPKPSVGQDIPAFRPATSNHYKSFYIYQNAPKDETKYGDYIVGTLSDLSLAENITLMNIESTSEILAEKVLSNSALLKSSLKQLKSLRLTIEQRVTADNLNGLVERYQEGFLGTKVAEVGWIFTNKTFDQKCYKVASTTWTTLKYRGIQYSMLLIKILSEKELAENKQNEKNPPIVNDLNTNNLVVREKAEIDDDLKDYEVLDDNDIINSDNNQHGGDGSSHREGEHYSQHHGDVHSSDHSSDNDSDYEML